MIERTVSTDTNTGNSGNTIDGGEGNDTFVINGDSSDYRITDNGDGTHTIASIDGNKWNSWDDGNFEVTVDSVENIQFNDTTVIIGSSEENNIIAEEPTLDVVINEATTSTVEDSSGLFGNMAGNTFGNIFGKDSSETVYTHKVDIKSEVNDTDGNETLSDVTLHNVPNGVVVLYADENGDAKELSIDKSGDVVVPAGVESAQIVYSETTVESGFNFGGFGFGRSDSNADAIDDIQSSINNITASVTAIEENGDTATTNIEIDDIEFNENNTQNEDKTEKEHSDNSDANGKGGNKHDGVDKEKESQETAEDKKVEDDTETTTEDLNGNGSQSGETNGNDGDEGATPSDGVKGTSESNSDTSDKGVGNNVAAEASGKNIKDKFTDEDGNSIKNVDQDSNIVQTNSYEIGFSIENADEDTEIILDNIPEGAVIKDANGNIIEPNENGEYVVSPDANGEVVVTIDSPTELSDEQLESVDATVFVVEYTNTLANDTVDSISTDDDNDLAMTTDSDFTIDTNTEFELNYDNIDLDSQTVDNLPIENVNINADEVMNVSEESAFELPGSEETVESLDTDTWSEADTTTTPEDETAGLDLDTASGNMSDQDIQVMMDTMPTDHNM